MLGKFIFPILASAALLIAAEPRIIGYYPYWAQYAGFAPKDIRQKVVTHVHYGYFVPSEDGSIALNDPADQPNFDGLVALNKEGKIKLVFSIGGPGNAEAMQAVAGANRAAFVASIAAKLKVTGAFGIEIDWLPDASAQADYAALLSELNAAIGSASLAVTLPWNSTVAEQIPADALQNVDYATVHATDLMDDSKTSLEPNASFPVTEAALSMWVGKGVPADKLVPVIPFYGRSFAGAQGLGTSFTGPGTGNEGILSYKEIMEKLEGTSYKVTFDEASKSEVAVSKDETIVFTGIPSAKAVAELVKAKSYGGIAAYDLSGDFTHWKISLMVTVGVVLRPGVDYKKK